MAMGADYSFELISIETYAPQFIGHNNFFLGSVSIKHFSYFSGQNSAHILAEFVVHLLVSSTLLSTIQFIEI